MTIFRVFLVAFLLVLGAYTAVVIVNDGANLFPVFLGDMMAVNWSGQFNLDFMGFLMLSALWTAWRNNFSPQGLGLAVLAFFFGMAFLTIYLLVLASKTQGDARAMLLGSRL